MTKPKIVEIAFVIYAVNDIPRARVFYEELLGLTASSVWGDNDSGMIEYEIGPHTLAIGKGAPGFTPGASGGCVALEVEDFFVVIEALKKANMKFTMEPYESSICHMAVILDHDGNSLMIHKRKVK